MFNPNGSTKPQKTKNYLGNSVVTKSLWTPRSKNVGSLGKENAEMKDNSIVDINNKEIIDMHKIKNRSGGDQDENKTNGCIQSDNDDIVSGFLYDRLQKEVIYLRKFCETKESALNTKDEEIKVKYYHKTNILTHVYRPLNHLIQCVWFLQMLMKKVDALSKAIEVETRKRKVKQQGQFYTFPFHFSLFMLCYSDPPKMIPHVCHILQKLCSYAFSEDPTQTR